MKRALVISGGGSKGAFAVGVLQELFHTYPSLDFDIYVGTSTGSLVVSLAAVHKMEQLQHLYTHLTDQDIFIQGNIVDKVNDTSLFDVTPLWNLVRANYTDADYENLLTSGKQVLLNTVCLQTNELTVFGNDVGPMHPRGYVTQQTKSAEHFRRAMLASCCQPVFMQPIMVGRTIAGAPNPDYQYVDGGVLKYIGLQMAVDAGAEEILAILLSAEEEERTRPQFHDLLGILGETVDILVSDVGKNDLKMFDQWNATRHYITGVKQNLARAGIAQQKIDEYFRIASDEIFSTTKPVNLVTIRPQRPLGGGPGGLTFNPAEMTGMVAAGQMVFRDVAAEINFESFLS